MNLFRGIETPIQACFLVSMVYRAVYSQEATPLGFKSGSSHESVKPTYPPNPVRLVRLATVPIGTYRPPPNAKQLVFARSSSTEYAGIHYSGRKTTDTVMQPSALLKAGEECITGKRWGDYFGIGIDPINPKNVWIYGEWAKYLPGVSSDWDWGTWVGQVTHN